MSGQTALGPIVIDTDVFGADLVRRSVLAKLYEPIIVGRAAFISFQTAAELRYGAFRRGGETSGCVNSKLESAPPKPCTPAPNSSSPTLDYEQAASALVTLYRNVATTQTAR